MIELDDDLRLIFESANERWKKTGAGKRWGDFFVDGVAFQAGWLGLMQPELTAAYLRALADLHSKNDGKAYDRAKRMVDVARRELLEALDGSNAGRKPS